MVVHELAHQWFGDQVSVRRWRDIWLNEGFATWAEWRFDEAHGGPTRVAAAAARVCLAPREGTASGGCGSRTRGRPGCSTSRSTTGAAMALQALRHRIGTTRFLDRAAHLGAAAPDAAHGTGTVEEFEALAEQVSGQDLDAFFTAWLRTGARPARTAANGLV